MGTLVQCLAEDISSLPIPDAKFQEAKSGYLGQLIVIPETVAKKINVIKRGSGSF